MARTVAIGLQDFEKVRTENCFYVDKTGFIKEWWENRDDVTLITRPRRFGKTLNMSMLERFFSVKYAGKGKLFEGLDIWKEQKYRELQGTYPVISLSFAKVKQMDFADAYESICLILRMTYMQFEYILSDERLPENCKQLFVETQNALGKAEKSPRVAESLNILSYLLSLYYGKNVIVLFDEYDTPMQEAYVNGYWEEMVAFTRSLFNATFKTNPYLERAIMTGITRVSKESIFSDLNNLEVVTTTSNKYATAFGFTEQEVFAAMDELGYMQKDEVKKWYDGFTFGETSDIYNPWSIINFLSEGKLNVYWANTSSNSLVGKLLREGNPEIKREFEKLLQGETLHKTIDEQIVFNQLAEDEGAIWSLLVASGYLKLENTVIYGYTTCDLRLTNLEVKIMFQNMVKSWFAKSSGNYNEFIRALLLGDLDAMNEYMNRVTESVFSSFDAGRNSSRKEPERFYHGFVLGLMVSGGTLREAQNAH
jgi:hypothetical protein